MICFEYPVGGCRVPEFYMDHENVKNSRDPTGLLQQTTCSVRLIKNPTDCGTRVNFTKYLGNKKDGAFLSVDDDEDLSEEEEEGEPAPVAKTKSSQEQVLLAVKTSILFKAHTFLIKRPRWTFLKAHTFFWLKIV